VHFGRYRSRADEAVVRTVPDATAGPRSFVRKHKVPYPVPRHPRLPISHSFGFNGTPYTVVIDRRGEMVAQIHGASAVTRLPKILDDLLKETPKEEAPKEEAPRS